MATFSTSKGNGGHNLCGMENNKIVDFLEDSIIDNYPRTYDSNHYDDWIESDELKLVLADENKDGYTDVKFYGTILRDIEQFNNQEKYGNFPEISLFDSILEYSVTVRKIPIELIFLFNSKKQKFIPIEYYSQKYPSPYISNE